MLRVLWFFIKCLILVGVIRDRGMILFLFFISVLFFGESSYSDMYDGLYSEIIAVSVFRWVRWVVWNLG